MEIPKPVLSEALEDPQICSCGAMRNPKTHPCEDLGNTQTCSHGEPHSQTLCGFG